jgi:hypothetical protein
VLGADPHGLLLNLGHQMQVCRGGGWGWGDGVCVCVEGGRGGGMRTGARLRCPGCWQG